MLWILWPPMCFPNPPIKICREKHHLNTEEAQEKEARRLQKGKRKRVDTSPGDEELQQAVTFPFSDSWNCLPTAYAVLFCHF